MSNTYDPREEDDFLRQQARGLGQQPDRAVRRNALDPSAPDPEAEGRVRAIAEASRLPEAQVRIDPEGSERTARAEQASQQLQLTPRLREWLGDDRNYAVASDDVESLSTFERWWRSGVRGVFGYARRYEKHGPASDFAAAVNVPRDPVGAFAYGGSRILAGAASGDLLGNNQAAEGELDVEYGRLAYRAQQEARGWDSLNDTDRARLEELAAREGQHDWGPFIIGPTRRLLPQMIGAVERSADQAGERVDEAWDNPMPWAIDLEMGPTGLNARVTPTERITARRVLEGGVAATIQAPAAVLGAIGGGGGGYLSFGYEMETGIAYDQMIRSGIAPDIAAERAEQYGAWATAIEFAGDTLGFRLSGMGHLATRGLMAERVLTSPGASASGRAIGAMLGTAADQGLEEASQEYAQIIHQDLARQDQENPDGESRVRWSEVLTPDAIQQIIMAGYVGAQAGFGLSAIPAGANFALDTAAVQRAERNARIFEEMTRAAQESRVGQRLPAALESAVSAATENGSVFIDADRFVEHFQSAGVSPYAVAAELGIGETRLAEALAGHGTVEIPTGVFAARVLRMPAHASLANHARISPDDATPAEIESANELFKAAVERIAQESEAVANDNDLGALIEERMRSLFAVAEREGGPRPEVARRYAQLAAALPRAMVARARNVDAAYADQLEQQFRSFFEGRFDVAGPGREVGPSAGVTEHNQRGVGPDAGPVRNDTFEVPAGVRMSERMRKIVEMAVNGASNDWIAEEMGVSALNVRVTLNDAKGRLGGQTPWEAARSGSRENFNSRTGEDTAETVRMLALRRQFESEGSYTRGEMIRLIAERLGVSVAAVDQRLRRYDKASRGTEGEVNGGGDVRRTGTGGELYQSRFVRLNLPDPFVGAVDVIMEPGQRDLGAMVAEQRRAGAGVSVRWGIFPDGTLWAWDGHQTTHSMAEAGAQGDTFALTGEIEVAEEIPAVIRTARRLREANQVESTDAERNGNLDRQAGNGDESAQAIAEDGARREARSDPADDRGGAGRLSRGGEPPHSDSAWAREAPAAPPVSARNRARSFFDHLDLSEEELNARKALVRPLLGDLTPLAAVVDEADASEYYHPENGHTKLDAPARMQSIRFYLEPPEGAHASWSRAFDQERTYLAFDVGPDWAMLREAHTSAELRGAGVGGQLHRDAIDKLLAQGKRVYSDYSMSDDALHLWQNVLPRLGYEVAPVSVAATRSESGQTDTNDMRAHFEVRHRADSGDLNQFAGERSLGYDEERLLRAGEMEEIGYTPNEIWRETGWWRDPNDQKWRYEINDEKAEFINRVALETRGTDDGLLVEVLRFPELFAAYPQLANLGVGITIDPDLGGPNGAYDEGGNVVVVNAPDLPSAMSALLHEVQHAVQAIEGFANGGSVSMSQDYVFEYLSEVESFKQELIDKFFDGDTARFEATEQTQPDNFFKVEQGIREEAALRVYLRFAGEIEARNVQRRRGDALGGKSLLTGEPRVEPAQRLSADERKTTDPSQTVDRPLDSAIVPFESGGRLVAIRSIARESGSEIGRALGSPPEGSREAGSAGEAVRSEGQAADGEARAPRPGKTLDELAAELAQAESLDQNAARGSIRYDNFRAGEFGQAMIRMGEASDLSTFLHEFGHLAHLMLESMATDAKAPAEFRQMWADTLSWWGVTQDQWSGFSTEQKTEYFERWARTFEAYLMEGKAPSLTLRESFAAFKAWLTQIYRSVFRLDHNLNPQIRDVFDRLLATDAEIAEARAAMGADFALSREAFKTDEEFQQYVQAIADAKEAQDAELRARVMDRFVRKERRWWRAERARVRPTAEIEVDSDPARRAFEWLAFKDWRAMPVETSEEGVELPADASLAMPEGLPDMALDWSAVDEADRAALPPELRPLASEADAEAALENAMALKRSARTAQPRRLWKFIKDMGGIRDEGGEVRQALGSARARPGLINNTDGLSADELALRAYEAGYFGTPPRAQNEQFQDGAPDGGASGAGNIGQLRDFSRAEEGSYAFQGANDSTYLVRMEPEGNGAYAVTLSEAGSGADAPLVGVSATDARTIYRRAMEALYSDAQRWGRQEYVWRGHTPQQQRIYEVAFERFEPPRGYERAREGEVFIWRRTDAPNAGAAAGGNRAYREQLRADGFDVETPLFHGTGQAFEDFRSGEGGAVFLTTDPELAGVYAGRAAGHANVRPVYARMGRVLRFTDTEVPQPSINAERIAQARREGYDSIEVTVDTRGRNARVFQQVRQRFPQLTEAQVRERMGPPSAEGVKREIVILNPENIASQFGPAPDAPSAGDAGGSFEMFQGETVRRRVIDTDRGPVIVNPNRADMARMTRVPLGQRDKAWMFDSVRYIIDRDGNVFVGPGAAMIHDEIAAAAEGAGFKIQGYQYGDMYGHGAGIETGSFRRTGETFTFDDIRNPSRLGSPVELFQDPPGGKRPTPRELLDALIDDLRNIRQVYSSRDEAAVAAYQNRADALRWFEARGIDLSGTKEEIRAQIADALQREQEEAGGGWDPNDIAPWFNFKSGDELIQALKGLKPRAVAIEDNIERRLEAEYGDPLADGTVAEAAALAAHIEAQSKRIEIELAAIQRATGGRVTPVGRAARAYAERQVQSMTVKQLRNYEAFLAGERRAARAAMEATEKKDFQTAALMKQRQLTSFWLYRAARSAAENLDKIERRWQRYSNSPGARAAIGARNIEQIDAILDTIETGRPQGRATQSLEEWVSALAAENNDDLLVFEPAVLQAQIKQRYRDMDYADVLAVNDALRNIETIGRGMIRLRNAKEAQRIADIVGELKTRIREEWEPKLNRRRSLVAPNAADKIGRQGNFFSSSLLKMDFLARRLDGFKDGGPFMRLLGAMAQDAENDLHERSVAATQEFLEIVRRHYTSGQFKRLLTHRIHIPTLGDARTKMQLIAYALNRGTRYNFEALLRGEGWTEPQYWQVVSTLDRNDWAFVSALWNYIGQWKEESFALDERTRGVRPVEELGEVFQLPDGTSIQGQYWPVAFDPERSDAAAQREAHDSVMGEHGGRFRQAATSRGRLVSRRGTGGQALSSDPLGVLAKHVHDSLRDITHRELVITLRKVKADKELRDMIARVASRDHVRALDAWTFRLAQKLPAEPFGDWGRIPAYLRRSLTNHAMGFKVSVATLNLLGHFQAVPRNGILPQLKQAGITLAAGFPDLVRRHAMQMAHGMTGRGWQREASSRLSFVQEKSKMMLAHTRGHFDRDISDVKGDLVGRREGQVLPKQVEDTLQVLNIYTNQIVGVPTWLAAYESALNGDVKGIKADDDAAAVDYADSVVRMTISAGATKDLSALVASTNQWQRLFTVFMNWANIFYNQVFEEQIPGVASGKIGRAQFAANLVWIWLLPSIITIMFYGQGERRDDEDEFQYWGRMAGSVLTYPLQTIPLVRDLLSQMVQGYESRTAIGNVMSRSTALKNALEDQNERQIVKQALLLTGAVTGAPAQLYVTGDYAVDLALGEERPLDDPIDALEEALLRDSR